MRLASGFLSLFALFVVVPFAEQSKPDPTVVQLQAEVESLKSQLDQQKLMYEFDMKACNGAMNAAREFVIRYKPQAPPLRNPLSSSPKPEVVKPSISQPKSK